MADTSIRDGSTAPLTGKAFDFPLIHEYATRIYYTRFNKMMAADPTAMPDHVELRTRTIAEVEMKYDNSMTLMNLESMIRVSNDPEQGFFFLKNLPGTVLRDTMASAEVEIERKEEKRNDITHLLGQTLDTHIKTANATLRLLRRFEAARDPDPDVVYVKEMVTASRKAMVEKQQALKAMGLLKD